jgi:hypothetical protein
MFMNICSAAFHPLADKQLEAFKQKIRVAISSSALAAGGTRVGQGPGREGTFFGLTTSP